MFTINEDLSIYVTRGDAVAFSVTSEENGVNYVFQPGDVVRIKVFGKKDAENVVLQKDFPVVSASEKVEIYLTEQDTKIGEVISKPTDYWYEVELNPYTYPQTIIGYDDDGAKVLKLFPEGRDLEEYEITEEDIPVVDFDLDLTSTRPVQNQAIARAIINLQAGQDLTQKAIAGMFVAPSAHGAVGDGETDDTAALQAAIDYCQETGERLVMDSKATYKVSTLVFTKPVTADFNGATIVSDSTDFAIKFDCPDTPEKRCVMSNAKIVAAKGLYIRCNLLTVSDVTIHCSSVGVETSDCYELKLENIKVHGGGNSDAVGYDLHCTDSEIMFCTATNIGKGYVLDNGTNYIYSLHGWNSQPIAGSVMMELSAARECIMNNIYCDCMEVGIVSGCGKLTVNNFIYSFLKSIGGDNRSLRAFNIVDGEVEINGGYVNYTGDGNTFVLSNQFITIRNVEDRAGVCGFQYTADDGTKLNINYENGRQFIAMDIAKEMAANLNYACKIDGLWIPTANYSGYAETTEVIDGVSYTLHIPVVFRFSAGTTGMFIYLYHDRKIAGAHLDTVL